MRVITLLVGVFGKMVPGWTLVWAPILILVGIVYPHSTRRVHSAFEAGSPSPWAAGGELGRNYDQGSSS